MLPADERRVLVLRAGVGPRDPRSRRATAAALGLALSTVRQREQAGVRQLRALDGSCGGAVVTGGAAFALAAASPGGADGGGPAAPGAGDGGRGARDGGEAAEGGVLGESEVMPDGGGAPDVRAAIFPGTLPSDGGDAALYVLAALALTLLGLTANRRSREWILHPYD